MMVEFDIAPKTELSFTTPSGREEHHIFEREDILAIEAALLSMRPLLLEGETGVGKSQLAMAAAAGLKRPFYSKVVEAQTEAMDLRWTEDLIARLAQAQLVGALSGDMARSEAEKLDIRRFVRPGPLWWGFDWGSAARHVGDWLEEPPPVRSPDADPENGVVVLVDEIDKAERELANGLLEALGTRSFRPPKSDPVNMKHRPLIVVTTNKEQPLPAAFIRRCVVHTMRLPVDDDEFTAKLAARGAAHFPDAPENVLDIAARMTSEDRNEAKRRRLTPLPGQAEYIDLLTAALSPHGSGKYSPLESLELLRPYYLRKHSEIEQ